MSTDEFTYKSQDVHYLGFLEAQLRDLQGTATLAYELIQNADDVVEENGRSATTLTFDVTDDALIVENDGLFRDVDFARLQHVASGGKREEAETTGAFGIGFTAVYQVTDAPEIFSSGRHWIIRPDAPADRRIQERQMATDGTRFRLPWAFDPASVVRRTLRLPVIRPDELDGFAQALGAALETAALFLRRLQVLTVRRNGALVRQIRRHAAGSELVLADEAGQTRRWLLLDGAFADEAARLRAAHPWQIEAARRSDVRLAIPAAAGPAAAGRLYAVLPTAQTMPLPACINADFFPTTDRKRLHFDGGYQAAWNRAALACAADVLARHLEALPAALGAAGLWQLLQKTADTAQLAAQGELPAAFGAFWQAAAPRLAELPLVRTLQGDWRRPAAARLAPAGTPAALLDALRLPAAHPELAPFAALLRQAGVPALAVADVAAALGELGMQQRRPLPLFAAPDGWRDLGAWQALWALLDRLLAYLPPAERAAALAALRPCNLVLTVDMELARLPAAFRGTAEAQALFPEVAWLHDAVPPERFPGRDVPRFGVRQAVARLAETPVDQLEEAWRLGRLDVPRLFRWFEQQPIEIFGDDPALPRDIRRLPLCPVAGALRPLADLAIPGGFEDPLGLVGVVDLAAVGGRREFLRDLGAQPLDFDTYVRLYLPRVLTADADVAADARQRLVQLLAERLGALREDEVLQAQLGRLPLVACLDGSFRAAVEVYATRDALALLGEGVHVAEPPPNTAVAALHRWLGVRPAPDGAALVAALLAVSGEPLSVSREPLSVNREPLSVNREPLSVNREPLSVNRKPLSVSGAGSPEAEAGNTEHGIRNTEHGLRNTDYGIRLTAHGLRQAWAIWRRLGELLAAGEVTVELLAPLRGAAVVPDGAGVLRRPEAVCLVDAADLASEIADRHAAVAARLLPADVAGAAALRAVGVRPLRQALEKRVAADGEAAADGGADKRMGGAGGVRQAEPAGDEVAARLAARRGLMARVLAAAADGGADKRMGDALLDGLRVRRVAALRVQRVLVLGDLTAVLAAEEAAALLDAAAGTLFVAAGASWAAVARALAEGLRGETAVGGLALGLRTVLAAETAAEAAALLDELGI